MPTELGRFGVLLAVALVALGCGPVHARPVGDRPLRVVAAENFWGSIAAQVGGDEVTVTDIINRPGADPHDYEPTPADARHVAAADLVIVNGLGYDGWAQRLLAASPGVRVLDVGRLLGLQDGANPHRWYDPADVTRVVSALTADLTERKPSAQAALEHGRAAFETQGLREYDAAIAQIRSRYAGVTVGASESIFSLLAPALGLDVVTPARFLRAISEGSDVSASDKTTIDRQIATRAIKIYVYNSQNATPDIQEQLKACRAHHIPTTTITETLTPAGATFQQWQVRQLQAIAAALAAGTGR